MSHVPRGVHAAGAGERSLLPRFGRSSHPSRLLQLDGDLALAPGFLVPGNTDYVGYHKYIDECLPPETPYLYGMHPNAEIEFLTSTSERLFRVVLEMQPRDTGAADGAAQSRDDILGACIDELLEKLPDNFAMAELQVTRRGGEVTKELDDP